MNKATKQEAKISWGLSISEGLGAATRSNTIDTVEKFIPQLQEVDRKKEGQEKVAILFVAENPHGLRMSTATAITINNALPEGREVKILLLGNGLSLQSFNPQITNSPLASLVSENLATAISMEKKNGIECKRDVSKMNFSVRAKMTSEIKSLIGAQQMADKAR